MLSSSIQLFMFILTAGSKIIAGILTYVSTHWTEVNLTFPRFFLSYVSLDMTTRENVDRARTAPSGQRSFAGIGVPPLSGWQIDDV